jgi:hypothetical protein
MQLPGRVFVVMTPDRGGSVPDEIDDCCQQERFKSVETLTHIRRLLMLIRMLDCSSSRAKLKANVFS